MQATILRVRIGLRDKTVTLVVLKKEHKTVKRITATQIEQINYIPGIVLRAIDRQKHFFMCQMLYSCYINNPTIVENLNTLFKNT